MPALDGELDMSLLKTALQASGVGQDKDFVSSLLVSLSQNFTHHYILRDFKNACYLQIIRRTKFDIEQWRI